ncbi:bifunctional metallophosphatase/5'-nucleotidase [Aestuariibacter salexigens]|uniref:bifunctional metallophosphatase/5'-nucleotidase n=1 Tax=Aestuariibacter salexigens TaxID=226010 RepID=UPI000408258E|nr:5'-nucleotidase C-terminal domain-containing protein [Aestuariibacter salexigens]
MLSKFLFIHRHAVTQCVNALMLFFTFSFICKGNAQPLHIVFAADLPVIASQDHGDYAELGTVLTQQRRQDPSTVFIFGGASLAPSPMSSFDRGAHIIDLLNSLEPDVMTVTKREFSYFEDELSLRAYEAAFPMVISNVRDPITEGNMDGLEETVIIQRQGLKIGIISAVHESVTEEYLLQRVGVLDPEQAITRHAVELRESGVDIIVLVYSSNFPFVDNLLTESVIDVALRSDPHFELSVHNVEPQHPHNILVTDAGHAALVSIQANPNNADVELSWQNVSLQDYPALPSIESLVTSYSGRLANLLNEELAVLTTSMDTRRVIVRTRESGFGNFVADAIRKASQADISLINGGVIRGERIYQPDTVLTRRDIAVELPFRSRIAVIQVTGQQLLAALENGFSQIEQVKGRFPQISGMQVAYDPAQPAGKRVISVSVDGQRLQLDGIYKLATTDYLAGGGDGYVSLKQAQPTSYRKQSAPLISDIVIDQLLTLKQFATPIESRLLPITRGSNDG